MSNRARLALILSLLVAAFFLAEFSHRHADGESHNKCPLCIAVHSPFLPTAPVQGMELVVPAARRITPRYVSFAPLTPDYSLPIIRSPTV